MKEYKIYKGNGKTHNVFVKELKSKIEYSLDPKLDICNHSPHGFQWGYGGSGPAQLALAILYDLYGNCNNYMDFKWKVIAQLPMDNDFKITEEQINVWKENKNQCMQCLKENENLYRNGENTLLCGYCAMPIGFGKEWLNPGTSQRVM